MKHLAIGGYFGLESGNGDGLPWLKDAIAYCSARAAITAWLTHIRPKALWLPNFICGAVTDAAQAASVSVHRYALNSRMGVPSSISLAYGECIICVDYFGTHGKSVQEAIVHYGVDRVVVDASQSLYWLHQTGGTSFYSLRKFFGIPDGGLIRTAHNLSAPQILDEQASLARTRHLICRAAGLVEPGYTYFKEAEASLDCRPIAMSRITRALLQAVDVKRTATRRVANYRRLEQLLRAAGFDVAPLPPSAVPLCCPVRYDNARAGRTALAEHGVFTPEYWPDITIPADDIYATLAHTHTLYLPCDQRYTASDMQHIVDTFVAVSKRRHHTPAASQDITHQHPKLGSRRVGASTRRKRH